MRLHPESRLPLGRLALLVLSVCLLQGLGAPVVATDGDTVPGAPWARLASGVGNGPLQPGIRRPAVLGYTNSYIYGANTPFGNSVEYSVSVDDEGYGDPVTLYIYWWNRDTDQFRWYSLPGGGFQTAEIDVFGSAGQPTKIVAPSLADFPIFGADGAFGPYPGSLPQTTGQYALVFELRNSTGAQVVARDYALFSFVDGVVQKSGNIGTETWSASNAYFLATPVAVTGGTLTIEAGTVVLGSEAGQGYLLVAQDGTIQANGTSTKPIVFTSEKERSDRAVGDWGGLVINGEAPVNIPNPTGEGDSGPYGGDDPNDSSGSLQYVRVEFAGIRFNDEDELNAIAMQGVGRGTVAENLQTISGADDGIEMFGGTVNGKNWFVYNANDDSIDWTFGWTGSVTNACAVQTLGDTDHLFEGDNNEDNPSLEPQSSPTFTNFAGISRTANDNPGLLIRRGSGLTLVNAGILGAARAAIRIGGETTRQNLSLQDVLGFNVGTLATLGDDDGDGATETTPPAGLTSGNPRFANPTSPLHPDLAPLGGDNSCTTRSNDWTQEPWVNYDAGPQ